MRAYFEAENVGEFCKHKKKGRERRVWTNKRRNG